MGVAGTFWGALKFRGANGAILAGLAGGSIAAGVDLFGRLEPLPHEIPTLVMDPRARTSSVNMSSSTAITEFSRNKIF